jgi:hypothetical protein
LLKVHGMMAGRAALSRNVVGFYTNSFRERVGLVGAMGAVFMADIVILTETARFLEVMKEVINDNGRKNMAAAVQRSALVEFRPAFFEVGFVYNFMISVNFIEPRLFPVYVVEIVCALCFSCVTSSAMAGVSALEQYYQRLPNGDGSGSSSFAGTRSSIASSTNNFDAQMHLLHSVCPPVKKKKLQPQGITVTRSNPDVKLLTPPTLHV